MYRIESLLSARQFVAPQIVGDQLYFVSNLSGRLSLYAMNYGGSVPRPLLPPHIALQNPHLMAQLYHVFPRLGKILLMLDHNGDENYQPMWIPIEGGFPEPAFGDRFEGFRVQLGNCDIEKNIAYFFASSRSEAMSHTYQAHLETDELVYIASSKWGMGPDGIHDNHDRIVLNEGYTVGDQVLYLWEAGREELKLLYGKPLDQREEGEQPPLNSIYFTHFTPSDRGLIFITSLFEDTYSLGYLSLEEDGREPEPIALEGVQHDGVGEMEGLEHLRDHRYALTFNIDGASWVYEGELDEAARTMRLRYVICGQGRLSGGVLESRYYDEEGDRHILSFSTATSPTQIYTVEGAARDRLVQHTDERILGIPEELLSPGEDASFISHDGLRVSARLYLPAEQLGFEPPYPLVYYVHGGPQSQERPDFAWFSMPLIQFLTLNGFAVFVPNARGSTGYGLSYMKHVDRDWGGQDRLDHVHAMTQVLPHDGRVDTSRAGVVGRSYGGFMTMTLATRHPELWSAAVEMFGPYNLFTFMDRLPETWKPYFHLSVGHPEKDHDFLVERSPATHIQNLACPMMVVQGANDPRVIERESRDVVEQLRAAGKEVSYLLFEDEGHDVIKHENKVRCYNEITDFVRQHLMGSA